MSDPDQKAIDAVKAEIASAKNGARELARAVMKRGRSRWIETSIREGWSYNLEELMRSSAYNYYVEHRQLPTLAWFDGYAVPSDRHTYFARHGRQHVNVILEEIIAERGLTPRSRAMTGEGGE